jgi:hypothetical protein
MKLHQSNTKLKKFWVILYIDHDEWESVTTAWRVLRLQVEEERPQMWMIVATVLHKQSRTADKGFSFSP